MPMARSEMRKICKQVREKWDVIKIAIFHRIGYVINMAEQGGGIVHGRWGNRGGKSMGVGRRDHLPPFGFLYAPRSTLRQVGKREQEAELPGAWNCQIWTKI